MRLLNLIVAAALVLAAAYVYKIKVAATVEAERVAKLRMEITRERDAIAALRAETAKLENPARIQRLAGRYLLLLPLDPAQIETIDAIPLRRTDFVEPETVTAAPAQPEVAPAKPQAASKSATAPAQPQAASKSTTAAVHPRPARPQPKPAPLPPTTAPLDIITGAIRPPAPIGAR